MKNISLIFFIFLLSISLVAQDDVTIGKYRKFESALLGGEVTYLEHLPDGYDKSVKTYPVLFTMNGQITSQFANDAATLDNLSGDRIPDMILIGISNTGAAAKYWSCPNDSGYVKGGETFSSFLKDELIPEINKNYRTNGYQILAGQSNTGLFVMYNFLSCPALFNAYIVASPMFGWCPHFFLNTTNSFLKDHPDINNRLYISYGNLDYVQVLNYISDFEEVLEQSPESLEWKVDRIENCTHVPFSTLNNALLFFFSGCTMNADLKKMAVTEIRTHFEALSQEYGFPVYPKAGALFDLVYDLGEEQKFDQAIDVNKYLISLYPDSEFYLYYLGRLYQNKGDLESAKEYYNKALGINPDFEQAKTALIKIESL